MSLKEVMRAIQTEQSIQSTLCKVISVDGLLCDCSPVNGNADILEVRLNASGLNGFVITPKVGSYVMVTRFERFEAFISSFSDVDKITFNGGANDGLVLVNQLVNKLNALENKVNSIISTFNAHVHAGVTIGSDSSAVTPTLVTGTLTPTVKSDIENANITQ